MSEQPEAYQIPPTPFADYIQQRRSETATLKEANWQMYQILLSETASMLHGTAQLTQDVLHQICVEHNSKLGDVLLLVHDFLATFQLYQQHEAQPEPVEPESPFMFRREA